MFLLFRTITYATLFIGFMLLYIPGRLLAWGGLVRPQTGLPGVLGFALGTVGAAIALWSVGSLLVLGRGIPAPFDPPRHLVIRGPYRYVRNPMYLGAVLALAGAAIVYRSGVLLGYAGFFLLLTHIFVRSYEEPTLRRMFGGEYASYCASVRRWRPRLHE
jgi:protein-S-isoprenylcysteine O-methyltransferase Ste14